MTSLESLSRYEAATIEMRVTCTAETRRCATHTLDGPAWRAADGSICGYGFVSAARCREIPCASHTSKIIVKPCAGKLHAGLKGGLLGNGPV